MLSRRHFLGSAGAGALVGCSPDLTRHLLAAQPAPAPDLKSMRDLPERADLLLGYPVNMRTPPREFFEWRKQIAAVGVDQFAFNNVGNPQEHSHIPFNTHALEREVIARFAKLYGFDPKAAWGFVSNSGTDSNMHGMYMGRTILARRTGRVPKVYFTREAHYSIQILRDLMGLEWVEVGTEADGGMDAAALGRKLADHPDNPALVVATIGTTFKGAIDSVDGIRAQLKGREAFLHLDAALFGGYLPHTKFAAEVSFAPQGGPAVGRPPRYDSLAVSCHKFFGFPSPAGLFLTTKRVFEEFQTAFAKVHDPAYIHQVPGTITCSRDAVKPAEFLYFSSEAAFARQAEDARAILENAGYLTKELRSRFPELRAVRAGDRSNTVYFRQPSDRIVEKYSLATMTIDVEGKKERYAHVVVMPHAGKPILDRFLEDLAKDAKK